MRERNIMCVAINGNITWWRMEEICFAQIGYCFNYNMLIILYSRTATTLSYLFNTAFQDDIDCFWPFVAARDICCIGIRKHLFTSLVALC